ncbi:hypothetical protein LY78DRAFT_349832 [Colletotrichum sublineola]|nr:hypothetical protein LY78DRAFT_349832 [Colletotrichum sublineola]
MHRQDAARTKHIGRYQDIIECVCVCVCAWEPPPSTTHHGNQPDGALIYLSQLNWSWRGGATAALGVWGASLPSPPPTHNFTARFTHSRTHHMRNGLTVADAANRTGRDM